MKLPDPQSKRTERRARRKFTGSRATRRNARRLEMKAVLTNYAGTSPQTLPFEGANRSNKGQQQDAKLCYRGGGNNHH